MYSCRGGLSAVFRGTKPAWRLMGGTQFGCFTPKKELASCKVERVPRCSAFGGSTKNDIAQHLHIKCIFIASFGSLWSATGQRSRRSISQTLSQRLHPAPRTLWLNRSSASGWCGAPELRARKGDQATESAAMHAARLVTFGCRCWS
jgi:hypothetical protein